MDPVVPTLLLAFPVYSQYYRLVYCRIGQAAMAGVQPYANGGRNFPNSILGKYLVYPFRVYWIISIIGDAIFNTRGENNK